MSQELPGFFFPPKWLYRFMLPLTVQESFDCSASRTTLLSDFWFWLSWWVCAISLQFSCESVYVPLASCIPSLSHLSIIVIRAHHIFWIQDLWYDLWTFCLFFMVFFEAQRFFHLNEKSPIYLFLLLKLLSHPRTHHQIQGHEDLSMFSFKYFRVLALLFGSLNHLE
jgi:hypothetical protein